MHRVGFIIACVCVCVYHVFRLHPSHFTRILQGDILFLPVTLKLNPWVKGRAINNAALLATIPFYFWPYKLLLHLDP